MNFTDYDLGFQPAGTIVTVTLSGTEANVRLMDEMNFSSYRAGHSHRYFGGHAQRSPVVLTVPTDTTWHLVIDLGGFEGQVRSAVQVRRPAGSAMRS